MAAKTLRSASVRSALIGAAALVATLLWVLVLVPGGGGDEGRGTPAAILFDAAVRGLAAGLTAVGLIVVYRSVRVINFAQTAMGSVGAILIFKYTMQTSVPFWVALPIGLLAGVVVGVAFDLAFGRRFANAPRLVLTVFTIAFAFLLAYQAEGASISNLSLGMQNLPGLPRARTLSLENLALSRDPRPDLPIPGFEFHVGSLPLEFGFGHLFTLQLVALTLIGLWAFYRFTRLGTALRALADNPERAALLGISTGALTSVVWALSALISTVGATATGLLAQPSEIGSFAPEALFAALAAAIVAKMRSIPVAMVVAVAISVINAATEWSYPSAAGYVDLGVLGLVVVALAIQRKDSGRSESGAAVSWQASNEPRPIPRELATVGSVRTLRVVLVALVGILAVVYPLFTDVRTANLVSIAFLAGIVGLSLVVLTGWAGQVSLGQYGFVAIGAVVASILAGRVGLPGGFWVVVPLTTVVVAAVAALVGLPALRLPGLFLAVVTLGFGTAVPAVLLSQQNAARLLPDSVSRPSLFFVDFDNERNMYYLCLLALLLSLGAVRRLRSTRVGRLLIAARDNEPNLQSGGIALLRTKLLAFVISGALCGFAGAIFAYQQRTINGESFGATISLNAFLFAVVGGIGAPAGAVLGELYGRMVTQVFESNVLLQSMQAALLVGLLLFAPGGFSSMLVAARDSMLRIIAQRRRIVVPSLFADIDPEALRNRLVPLAEPMADRGLNGLAGDERYHLPSQLHPVGAASEGTRS